MIADFCRSGADGFGQLGCEMISGLMGEKGDDGVGGLGIGVWTCDSERNGLYSHALQDDHGLKRDCMTIAWE